MDYPTLVPEPTAITQSAVISELLIFSTGVKMSVNCSDIESIDVLLSSEMPFCQQLSADEFLSLLQFGIVITLQHLADVCPGRRK